MSKDDPSQRVSSGLNELDTVLSGGYIPRSTYLIRGGPGQGKTTLGLHFLTAAAPTEGSLFIGFQETEEQLRSNAASVGIDVAGVRFLSLAPDEQFFINQESYDIFSAADVETDPIVAAVTQAVDAVAPQRVFVDSMTQLRFLSADTFQYRKLVLSFLRYFRDRGATVLFSSESSSELPDEDLQFIADGVITLGSDRDGSWLEVTKYRGSGFRRGRHQVRVGARGLEVFPRPLPPRTEVSVSERTQWTSGMGRLDEMLHGGLEAGTVTLITGPSGTGKSTLAAMFAAEAAKRGRKAGLFAFEEEISSLLQRCERLSIPLRQAVNDNLALLEQVEPMRYLGDEFTLNVQDLVEREGVDLVVLDSIAGYELTLGDSENAKASLHAMAKTLARNGVTVILVNEVEAVTGQFQVSERGISYLADNVILLRYVETGRMLQKVIGVLKKRMSGFDRRLLTFDVGPSRFTIHEPEGELHGVLSGLQLPTNSLD